MKHINCNRWPFQKIRILPKRNNHILTVFGKAMFAERKKSFSTESGWLSVENKTRLQKQIPFGQPEIFCRSNLWEPQKCLVHFKDSKGNYGKKDRLFRKEGVSKAGP